MTDPSRARLLVLQVLVVSLVATLLGRLWFLQVHEGPLYAVAASDNRVREVVVPARRGEVYDARGRRLVANRTALVVSVDRARLARLPDGGRAVLARLGGVVGKDAAVLAREVTACTARTPPPCWRGSPYQPVPVQQYDPADRASLDRVLQIEEHREDFPGVTAEPDAVRSYPGGALAAHVLGYLGPVSREETRRPEYAGVASTSLVGRAGVEAVYEKALRGADGVRRLQVDHLGAVTGTEGETPPVAGDALVLSLDAKVQQVAEDALRRAVLAARQRPYYRGGGPTVADSGSVVVMEARTGRVVALASYPSYDPAIFTGGISDQEYADLLDPARGEPLLFRATQGAYAPASTFKVVTSLGAVANGQAGFDTVLDCPGSFAPLGGKRNFEGADLGRLTLRTAIVRSCDTNFYKFAYDAWVADGGLDPVPHPTDPTATMARAFGLGERTGIDLPAESRGLLPTRAWRRAAWMATRQEYCTGARNPDFPEQRRRDDQAYCDDGWKLQGGQAANLAIGQGEVLLTPLQLASVYATVANGGTVLRPTVARALLSPDGRTVHELRPQVQGRIPVRPEVVARLRDALHGVTSEPGGTARAVFAGLPLAVAGKTGTGEVNGRQDTSWFASFAPADHPELVVVGMVSQGGTGAGTAAPLVRDVYAGIYGLDGRPAALPGGRLSSALPVVRPDGTVGPPGTAVPVRPRTVPLARPRAAP